MDRRSRRLDPVFLFSRDGDVMLFKTAQEAADWMEAIDVEGGEYTDCFHLNGERLRLDSVEEQVHLLPTGDYDLLLLSGQLRRLAERNGYRGDDPDPRTVANEVFANEWRRRWPRWPSWLDRRLHGDGPPTIEPNI